MSDEASKKPEAPVVIDLMAALKKSLERKTCGGCGKVDDGIAGRWCEACVGYRHPACHEHFTDSGSRE